MSTYKNDNQENIGVKLNADALNDNGNITVSNPKSDLDEHADRASGNAQNDTLDLSSLSFTQEKEDTADTDGSRLYHETVLLLESGDAEVHEGITLLKKAAERGQSEAYVYLGQIHSNPDSVIYNPALAFDFYSLAAKEKNPDGYYNLGLCYFKGFGCKRDFDAAVEAFCAGARCFNANCIFALGICYETGVGCEINYEYAVRLYEKGYELGHAGCASNLGGCYFYGHGVIQDREKAKEIFARAAELGSSYSECRLGDIIENEGDDEKNAEIAFSHYKLAAKNKNPIAMYKLAHCYDKGIGTEQNFTQAYKYYARSASLGYDKAKHEAGKMRLLGRGTKKNFDEAFALFRSAAENGYAPAEFEVANCYLDGIGAMRDRDRAYDYYCRAYESDGENKSAAAYRIGLCSLKGLGTQKDSEKAFEWFSRGADLGSTDATYMLGECYYFGVGTGVDPVAAFECFTKAEKLADESDDDRSKFVPLYIAIAQCLEKGIGTEKDETRALSIYKKAAETGAPEAEFRAGRAIMQGIGTRSDYFTARVRFLRAARKGYLPAMLTVGILSDEGKGVKINKNDAKSWYSKALAITSEPRITLYEFPERFAESKKLFTESKIKTQYRFGMLLARHEPSVENYIRAFEHIALAASAGFVNAQTEIAKIHVSGGDLKAYYESPFSALDACFEDGETEPDRDTLSSALNKLGDSFHDGKNLLQKNEAAAARCYRFAAELGNVEASYSYGWCLRHGVGVRENDAEAAKWLKMAADKGNGNAAYSYGLCCEEGSATGVKNKREALYYYRLAAGTGHVEAAKRYLALTERNQ